MSLEDFQEKAKSEYDFSVFLLGDPGYPKARKISNSRFGFMPAGIAYCEKRTDVEFSLDYCLGKVISGDAREWRIRSGGHHHEGMCTADDVLIIDLSLFEGIEFIGDGTAWIPSGMQLEQVYNQLSQENKTIPGGGCGAVNVGGLTQGGGWGPYVRKYGWTCDSVKAIEMVIIEAGEAKVVEVGPANEYKDLYAAVLGGGGGNFGVVLRFLFQLRDIPSKENRIWFQLQWTKEHLKEVLRCWFEHQHALSRDLTTFGRVTVVEQEDEDESTMMIGGLYLGTCEDCKAELARFEFPTPWVQLFNEKPDCPPASEPMDPADYGGFHEEVSRMFSVMQPGPRIAAVLEESLGRPDASTCDEPHPHKISSAFPADDDFESLIERICRYFDDSTYYEECRMYLSLHGLGGASFDSPKYRNSVPWRGKRFMLQPQAWWTNPDDLERNEIHIRWIEGLRQAMHPSIDGAFINFVDYSLEKNPETHDGRIRLLQIYYDEKLDALIDAKKKYDANDHFSFRMSIPTYR